MNKIYLLGDSTCQTNGEDTYPQTGWGQILQDYVTNEYKVINLAKNGRSTKSFIDEGLFDPCKKKLKKGDIVIIQFGHNDEKEDVERHTDPFTSYQDNLNYFIDVALKKGATPILISSIYRRQFIKEHKLVKNTHGLYPKAMKQVAQKRKVSSISVILVYFTFSIFEAIFSFNSLELTPSVRPKTICSLPCSSHHLIARWNPA